MLASVGAVSPLCSSVYAGAFSFAYANLSTGTGALLLFGAVQATMILAGLVSGECLSENALRRPIADLDDAPGRRHVGRVVSDQQRRHALARDLREHIGANLLAQRGIEFGKRLIEQRRLRLGQQRALQAYPGPLAA